jgi:hypothetical protein
VEYQAQRTEASVDKFLADVDRVAKGNDGGGAEGDGRCR